MTEVRSVRVIPELRAAHLSRHEWDPAETILYGGRNPDLGSDSVPSYCLRVSPLTVARAIRRLRPEVVETPEPLWLRALPLTAAAVAAARGRRTRARVVAYCIENNDVSALFSARGITLPQPIVGRFGRVVRSVYDKLAFGTPGARDAYASLAAVAPNAKQFLELAPPSPPSTEASGDNVLFVGRLERRKGLFELMQAWEQVETTTESHLTIVGGGELHDTVRDWVAAAPDRRRLMDQVPHVRMPEIYRAHRVLVAPSVRDGKWREQVGLPIKEALQYGLTIVTTAETGLAEWLQANGHLVITDINQLGGAITDAAKRPLAADSVASSLPHVDGRKQAHDWLRS